jgi:hypothetical protein
MAGGLVAASVPRLFPEATFVCLGGGPSLTPEDVNACRGRAMVIAVSDTYRLAPFAAALYSCDAKWWDHHHGVPSFAGLRYALEHRAACWPGVEILKNTGREGLETDPTGLRTGQNSGYQAINLAVHLGARRIILLGYDMQASDDGRTHWFGRHPRALERYSPYPQFIEAFGTLVAPLAALGIHVLNASRASALTMFPRVALETALAGDQVPA